MYRESAPFSYLLSSITKVKAKIHKEQKTFQQPTNQQTERSTSTISSPTSLPPHFPPTKFADFDKGTCKFANKIR